MHSFLYTGSKERSIRSCNCPFLVPEQQYNWLAVPDLGNHARSRQAEQQKAQPLSRVPALKSYTHLVQGSAVPERKVTVRKASLKEGLASSTFEISLGDNMSADPLCFFCRFPWQSELPE